MTIVWLSQWRDRARALKQETLALYLACRDRRTPWYARMIAALVVGYALSPIDLIPDFIPILGLLDDLILIPLGILLVRSLVPADVMVESREAASRKANSDNPRNWLAAIAIVLIWITLGAMTLSWLWGWL